jgi:hypothetical protein
MPGLTLRGWVRFVSSTGVIASSFNVSSVNRTAAGNYTVNLTNPLPDLNPLVDVKFNNSGATPYTASIGAWASSTTAISVATLNGSSGIDYGMVYVGIYA